MLGQRQDRDAGEIDLLVAGEMEKQIERAFETVHIDDQFGVAGDALVVTLGPEAVHRRGLAGLFLR